MNPLNSGPLTSYTLLPASDPHALMAKPSQAALAHRQALPGPYPWAFKAPYLEGLKEAKGDNLGAFSLTSLACLFEW